MSAHELSYVVITPVRNEAENLRRLARCLAAQTAPPRAWLVVDNGSSDETPHLVRSFAWEQPWISLVEVPSEGPTAPAVPVVRAFHAGLVSVDGLPDVIVKLDANVSFGHDYFERLLDAFAADPTLGIASGVCHEQRKGSWQSTHATSSSVYAAARAYRRLCLQHVLPLEERMGWVGADELKAQVDGWRTGIIDGLRFYHHRLVPEHEATLRRWITQGRGSRAMGYRFSYLVLRTLFHARRDPGAFGLLWGYVTAAARREPRLEAAARAMLRDKQRLRAAPARWREVRGRGSVAAP